MKLPQHYTFVPVIAAFTGLFHVTVYLHEEKVSESGDIINLFISICKPILPLYKPNSSIVILFFLNRSASGDCGSFRTPLLPREPPSRGQGAASRGGKREREGREVKEQIERGRRREKGKEGDRQRQRQRDREKTV